MTVVTLLSSLGGTLGLWLGFSLLAVGELAFSRLKNTFKKV